MTVRIISKPETKEGRLFSDAVARYAADIVSDEHYIEQRFFRNQTAMEASYNSKMSRLMGKNVFKPIGYVPEKVTAWTDGIVTIDANEDFLKKYSSLEALEGLAEHALCHVDDHLKRCIMFPTLEMETVRSINNSFPVESLSEKDRYELWKAVFNMQDEAIATKKALEFDPYSTIAEDYEIGNIVYDMITPQISASIVDEKAAKHLENISRKDFLFAITNFHIGKDASFLSSTNPTVRGYRDRFGEDMKAKERALFYSLASKIPKAKTKLENYVDRSHKLKDEFDALTKERKPETREDFSKLITEFLSRE
jgi:hypothetical protein